MTTNKPQIEAYLVNRIKGQGYGKPRKILDAEVYDPTSDSFFAKGAKEKYTVEPLVTLSKYKDLQAECEKLRALLLQSAPIIRAHAGASHMLEGFRPRRNLWDELVEEIDAAMQETANEGDRHA